MTNIFLKSIFLFYFRPKGFRGFFVKSWSHFYNVPLSPPTRNPSTSTCRPFFYSVFFRSFSCFLEICICCVMSDEVEADQRKSECSYTKLHLLKTFTSLDQFICRKRFFGQEQLCKMRRNIFTVVC